MHRRHLANTIDRSMLGLCALYGQLQDELDELQRQLDVRQGNYGNSLSSVKMIADAFGAFVAAADAVEGRVREFMTTADRMMKDPQLDSRRVRHEVDETERRWRTFYNSIRNYGAALAESAKFFENWQAVRILYLLVWLTTVPRISLLSLINLISCVFLTIVYHL